MNRKILIADDNRLNIKLMSDILEAVDFSVYAVDNGLPVLDLACEIKPDVILLDIMMPGMDGFEVCKLLKGRVEVRNIPIIMVTAKTNGADIRQALEFGAFDYIRKPVDEVEIIARINSAIRFKEQQDQLLEFATRDSLTGLYNRVLLMELFENELNRQKRNPNDIAFVMMDLDHFKRVNDAYGHMAGDLVLKGFSQILTSSVRQCDIVCRYGGEEFGMVVSLPDSNSIYVICERIRARLEEKVFNIEGNGISVTVSMGICIKHASDSLAASDMISKADEALYKAKNNGRNRIELY